MDRVEIRWQDLLYIFSVQAFGFFDGLSTYVVVQRYPIIYETSTFLRQIYVLLGPDGMLLGKIIIVIIGLSIAYIMLNINPFWKNMCIGIMAGVLIAGLLAGTSNLLLFMYGYSAHVHGFNIQELCLISVISLPALGLIIDLVAIHKNTGIEGYAEGEI